MFLVYNVGHEKYYTMVQETNVKNLKIDNSENHDLDNYGEKINKIISFILSEI